VVSRQWLTFAIALFLIAIPWMDTFLNSMGNAILPALSSCPLESAGSFGAYLPTLTTKCACVRPFLKNGQALEDELKKVTGIQGALFCHKGRFISVWATKKMLYRHSAPAQNGSQKMKNIFQKIIEGEIPCDKVFENEQSLPLKT